MKLTALATFASLAVLTAPSLASVQTYPSERGQVRVTEIAGDLSNPWALAFLPDGSMLVTERTGALRRIDAQGTKSAPLKGVPQVHAQGQGGLLDVALSPDFANDRLVYLGFAEAGDGASGTAVGRGRLNAAADGLEDFTVIFRQQPKLSRGQHYGVRLVFDRAGDLFIALGDNNERPAAQDLDKLQGKLVRIRPDGSIPPDNPFVKQADANDAIWSYGHRNQQGAALHPQTGVLWTHEHGPRGGDEINLPEAGKNYGWPIATHGINYSGLPIPEAKGKTIDGMEAPHHVWEQSPGISGMAFYPGDAAGAWQGNLFIGALATRELIRLELDGDRITHEERLLDGMNARIRDVRTGPDGHLYLLTDAREGQLLRVELQP